MDVIMSRPVEILLVEDNMADILLTEEALNEAPAPYTLHVARDGEEAMTFLRRQGVHAKAPRPDLILLDLNMPRKGGREVLARGQERPRPAVHPGRHPYHVGGHRRYSQRLRPSCQ